MPASALSVQVWANLDGFAWTQLLDVVSEVGLTYNYGIQGSGPLDTVASSGECTFALRNDAQNSGSTLGWYSPQHASCRTGWALGVSVQVWLVHLATSTQVWSGKVASITPDGGAYGNRRVHVVAYDYMRDLMRTEVRELEIAVSQTDRALVEAVLDALPDPAQPIGGLDLDDALDTYPYAFDELGGGQKAAAVLAAIARSGNMSIWVDGTGTLRSMNRLTRWVAEPVVAFLADSLHGITVTSDTDRSFNRFRVTIHPKTVGAASIVLFADESPRVVYQGQTIEFWVNYRDPTDVRKLIGATAVIAPVVSTDYDGRPLPDGTGSDLSAYLTVTVDAFASTAFVHITNGAAQDVWLVNGAGQPLFQIRGTPIYDDGERRCEAFVEESYGESPLDLDMPYQSAQTTGQGFADYFVANYREPVPLIELEAVANGSDELMASLISRTVGEYITVVEAVTGTFNDVLIQSVRHDHDHDGIMRCRFGLVPAPRGYQFPPPAPPPIGIDDTDLIMTYAGPTSGVWNLTTDGQLVLAPGDYAIAFNRIGPDIRVRGIAAGEPGGPCDNSNGFGGAGGHSGASNLGGVVVPLTAVNWSARVGSSNTDPDVRSVVFRIFSGTIVLQLTDTADVGAGGTDGELGGVPLELASGGAGGSGVTGGGGAGSAAGSPSTGGNGGDSSDQTGGTGGWAGGSPDGGDASPADANNAEPGTFGGGGFGGGAGGSALLGGVYAGGGGGGAGLGNGPFDGYGSGANGVMTIELA